MNTIGPPRDPTPRHVVIVATVAAGFEGLRAGASLLRGLLDMPARERIGDAAFAELSKATDLSALGVAFYVVFGVGGLFVTAVNLVVVLRARRGSRVVTAAATSALCSVIILLLTTQAAPLMWRVGSTPAGDVDVLHSLLDGFASWTYPRFACAIVSFTASLAVLTSFAFDATRSAGERP